MTNNRSKGFAAFTTILATAACAFAMEIRLDNVNWNQINPWEDYLPKAESGNVSAGCVPTAYAQLMAYHEWPVIVDDTCLAHAAIGVDSGTYIYRQDFNTPVYTKLDWNAMKNALQTTRGGFECGRLMAIVGGYSFPVYTAGGTASTVTCPHFNPWYEGIDYHANPLATDPDWRTKRDELFAAVKESIEAGLPLCAGFQSSQGPHAVVVQGYRDVTGVPEAYCNLGWGGSSNGWSSYDRNPSGKNFALTGIFANHAPRKMAQLEPLPAVSGMTPKLKWYAPKYWRELAPNAQRITGYQIETALASDVVTTWTDPFTELKQDYLLHRMCDGESSADDGKVELNDSIKLSTEGGGNQLWLYNTPDPRYYEWPESWVATSGTRLTFKGLVEYTEHMDGFIQIKVANQPWRTLYDLTEQGARDRSAGAWKDYALDLGAYAGQAFKLRLYVARRQRGQYNHWSWKFKDWQLASVKTFGTPQIEQVTASACEQTPFLMPGTYEFAVKPIINGKVQKCYRTVTTTVRAGAPAENALSVTYRGEGPTDGLSFACAHDNASVFTVTTSREAEDLVMISGNPAIFPATTMVAKKLEAKTWQLTLTPTEEFKRYKKYSDGQKLLLTLAAIDANGTAAYQDLSLTFSVKDNDPTPSEGGGSGDVTFVKSDFYLPEAAADEWVLVIGNEFDLSGEGRRWNDLLFTCGGERKYGRELPENAKVRLEITATQKVTGWPYYRRIKFDGNASLAALSIIAKDGGNQPLGFGCAETTCKMIPARLNVQGIETKLDIALAPLQIWIGYEGTVTTAPVYLEKCRDVLGVGRLNLTQKDNLPIRDLVDLSHFKGTVAGAESIPAVVEPTPDKIVEGEGSGEGTGPGPSTPVIDTNATDPVVSIYRSYGYDMTENYYDARKQAIQTGKMLFILSGSTSCNWCHKAMVYLQERSKLIDRKFVVYYAKLQNNGGKSPFQGGLPQYGTCDPRTVDAFTGTKTAAGTFDPASAWYSGQSNIFDSERGYSDTALARVIDAGANKTIGAFVKFTLEGPDRIFARTPTRYHLYAHFADGVKMEVDHNVEWKVEGDASVDSDGTLIVQSGAVKLSARNAFYNFGAKENMIAKTITVVEAAEVDRIEIDTTPFNLEDDPQIFLKARVTLKDGSVTEVRPTWDVRIKEFVELPPEAPIPARKDLAVTASETGEVIYLHRDVTYDGINGQDHILEATATAGGQTVTADIRVYGPSRLWASKWDVISGEAAALGSVVKVKVDEVKYTYAGKVFTTNDLRFADFQIQARLEGQYNIATYSVAGTALDVNEMFNMTGSRLQIRLGARRKGGKYTGDADNVWHGGAIDERIVTLKRDTTKLTDRNGIAVNKGWASIHFPNEPFDQALLDRDSDNDGFTNAEEFLLGTDPLKQDDCWKFTACHFDWPETVYYRVMFMNSQFAGRVYTIEGAESAAGPWSKLGVMKGEEPGVITEQDLDMADRCRYFRVKASLYPYANDVIIPGLGVYVGPGENEREVLIRPKPGERYPAFAVDANKTTYPICVDLTPVEGKATPLFSVTTTETEPGQLDRFTLRARDAAEGWHLCYETRDGWANFYTTKAPTSVKVKPGTPVVVSAADRAAAERLGVIEVADAAAKAAGQAKLLRIVAAPGTVSGTWTLRVEIDPQLMPVGRRLEDATRDLGDALGEIVRQSAVGAESLEIVLPAEHVSPGLYYSVSSAEDLAFATARETPRVLARGEDVVLTLPAEKVKTRFFRIKASLTE